MMVRPIEMRSLLERRVRIVPDYKVRRETREYRRLELARAMRCGIAALQALMAAQAALPGEQPAAPSGMSLAVH